MAEPLSPKSLAPSNTAFTRVELTLDSGHSLPPMKHELNLNRQDVEIKELKRLWGSASGEGRRRSLEAGIKELEAEEYSVEEEEAAGSGGGRSSDAAPAGDERGGKAGAKKGGARPWSSRPMSARKSSVMVMKTIPESKQHVRPLSSKVRGASTGITFNGEHDLAAYRRKPSHDTKSDTSVGSNDSVSDFGEASASDEVSGHEIKQLWASSYDHRHPVRNVVDRNSGTFWMSSGLFPQAVTLVFRRTIQLRKVMVYCAGARQLRLHWQSPESGEWRDLTETMSRDAPRDSVTEFVFTVERGGAAAAVRIEVLGAHDAFAVVRHLNFIEHASSIGGGSAGDDPPTSARRPSFSALKENEVDSGLEGTPLSPITSPRSFYSRPPRDHDGAETNRRYG